ncbi:hypothetical protein QQS21_011863, partial [Conoideocrella luteorostrata]
MRLYQYSAIATAVVAGLAAAGTDGLFESTPTPNLIPSQENAGSDKLFPMADCNGFRLEEATIDQMQKAMENGNLTSV